MRRHGAWLLLGVALTALVVGLVTLFRLRVAHGDVFPAYSSLRADPLGTRVLHDSLAAVPGLRVERNFRPLADLTATPARLVVLAGAQPSAWETMSRDALDALDSAVRDGSRLVIALRASDAEAEAERADREREKQERREKRAEERLLEEKRAKERARLQLGDAARRWGVTTKYRSARTPDSTAERAEGAPETLPLNLAWRSEAYFVVEPDAGWRVLYRRGGEPVLIERARGRGSIVLAADAYLLSNEALQATRESTLLAWIVGPHRRVIFDEAHLGVRVEPGVAALARRYGLAGAFFTLVLLAALFVWRQTARFVPPEAEPDEVGLAYHPAAGLEALLRRSVPAAELVKTCVIEWKPTARASDQARVDAALAALPAKASALERYNAALRALRRRAS